MSSAQITLAEFKAKLQETLVKAKEMVIMIEPGKSLILEEGTTKLQREVESQELMRLLVELGTLAGNAHERIHYAAVHEGRVYPRTCAAAALGSQPWVKQ